MRPIQKYCCVILLYVLYVNMCLSAPQIDQSQPIIIVGHIVRPVNFSYESEHIVRPKRNDNAVPPKKEIRMKQVTYSSMKNTPNNQPVLKQSPTNNERARGATRYQRKPKIMKVTESKKHYVDRTKNTTNEKKKEVPLDAKVQNSAVIEQKLESVENVQKIDAMESKQIHDNVEDAQSDGHGHGHDKKHSKGGGKEHHSSHHSKHGSGGDKGYKGHHGHSEGKEGHHNKEGHKGHYADKGGHKKKNGESGGHYGEYEKGGKGEKSAKFEESGKHSKGHSTKGGHHVHKKDEYEKKVEFFEEDYDQGGGEKHGEYHQKHGYQKGGKSKGGHHHSGHSHSNKGKKGHYGKGHHYNHDQGHNDEDGHDTHHDHQSESGHKSGKNRGRKWGFKKGNGGHG